MSVMVGAAGQLVQYSSTPLLEEISKKVREIRQWACANSDFAAISFCDNVMKIVDDEIEMRKHRKLS